MAHLLLGSQGPSHQSPHHRLIGPGHYHPSEETGPSRHSPQRLPGPAQYVTGRSATPKHSSSRRCTPGGSPAPNRSSPRRRPPGGSSQHGPSLPITPPLSFGQEIQTPVRVGQAIGVVHQPLPG